MSDDLTPEQAKRAAREFVSMLAELDDLTERGDAAYRSRTETLDEFHQRTTGGAGTVETEEREYAVTGTVRVSMRVFATGRREAREIGEQRLKEAVRDGDVEEVDCPDVEEL
jgi:hypothetical protein